MQFHILSFEGPDEYARAGGIASRITGLSEALAEAGFETHLWFVGDPPLPGYETRGQLQLHRWCQWISLYHPAGVYDGEDGKRADYAASLPPFLLREVLLPHLQCGRQAVVLDDEGVVAGRLEVLRKAFEDAPTVVMDARGLAVHLPAGAGHLSPEGLPDGLVPETDAEDGRARVQSPDQVERDSGAVGIARPG